MKAGWATKPLGSVCTLQRGFDLPTQQRTQGIFPLVSSSGIIDTHNEAPVKAPGVVTGRSGSVGNVFFIERDFWPLNTTLYVRDFHGNDPRFVFYLLSQFDLKRFAGGAGVPTLNRNDVHGVPVFVPDKIEEQQRIVAILDEAFAGIATARSAAEQNRQNARALFESYLQSVFSQRGEGWEETTIADATGGVFTGPFGSLLHKSDYIENGIPLVNPAHITNVGIEPDLRKTVSAETAQRLSSYIMRTGDIVIGRRGEMGRCAIVTDAEDGWLCGTGSFVIKPSNRCDTSYLVRLLRSESCKSRLEEIAGGAVMPNLSNTALGNFPIFLPPIDIQKAVLKEIDALHEQTQRLEALYQCKLEALDELKQSLLHQAFSGNL
ncbi:MULTISPECIES: restriction endonuclease subunit S [Pseudomonas]|uniref:restriction endonuclease subunit S n=1 Tax=Pseudomonas TaxID=286 RepID=UPI0009A3F46C|nr:MULTISPECIES: restriction endonuclease subunit S [Pseudomonas]MDI3827832.1 restriction endonuclease subunit S [Pseudomonas aeruginosa]MDP5585625.1 restriction endonuclease subunit S [Pseudomonas aeruginosa]